MRSGDSVVVPTGRGFRVTRDGTRAYARSKCMGCRYARYNSNCARILKTNRSISCGGPASGMRPRYRGVKCVMCAYSEYNRVTGVRPVPTTKRSGFRSAGVRGVMTGPGLDYMGAMAGI